MHGNFVRDKLWELGLGLLEGEQFVGVKRCAQREIERHLIHILE